MSKKLVAYFSAGGVTAAVAKKLSEVASADLYEIKPETLYTEADLDWRDKQSRSSVEMQDPSSRPPIGSNKADIEAYDVIFLGYPIWWYVAPRIINTFLESYNFSGKIIVPFATSGSSGMGDSAEKLESSLSSGAVWKSGKLLNGNPSAEVLAVWVESLNL